MPFLTTRSYGIVRSSLPGSRAALAAAFVSYSTSRRAGQRRSPVAPVGRTGRERRDRDGSLSWDGARGPDPPTGRERVSSVGVGGSLDSLVVAGAVSRRWTRSVSWREWPGLPHAWPHG